MKKFIIYGFKEIDDVVEANSVGYTLQLNPESIKRNRSISIDTKPGVDTAVQKSTFVGYADETMDLDFYIDSTGAISMTAGDGASDTKKTKSVDEELKELEEVVYDFESADHKPKYLFVAYGELSFRCMMTAFNIDYLLFDLDGFALRAKVHLSLKGYKELPDTKQSPDMSHAFTIREGDSLPLLCKEVYGKMDYYLQVAEHNGLTNFRELEVGSTIELPPLQR